MTKFTDTRPFCRKYLAEAFILQGVISISTVFLGFTVFTTTDLAFYTGGLLIAPLVSITILTERGK